MVFSTRHKVLIAVPKEEEEGKVKRGKVIAFVLWRLHLFWNAFLVYH